METAARYSSVFVGPEKTPEAFWISLRYFNLYRVAVAALFLTLTAVYGDALNLGSHSLDLFRFVAAAYLLVAVALQVVLRNLRDYFHEQLTLHVGLDVLAITLLMYASGGIRSGLGVMLLISLTAAAIVAPRRLTLLYASLATIALLLEHGYWVFVHDAPEASYLQPGLFAIGCFATASVTGWLSQRVAANERLAHQRGRELATQTRVSQLVIADMQDGVAVLDREGRIVQHNPQAQRLLGAAPLVGADITALLPGFAAQWAAWRAGHGPRGPAGEIEVRGREMGLRLLDTGTEEEYSVLFLEDTTRSREQARQVTLAALGRLTANIAHEIRNPLSAISHAAELLEEEKRSERRERLTRIIRDNTQRLDRLVNDVLQLNRRDRASPDRIRLRAWLEAFVPEFAANERVPPERVAVDAQDAEVRFDREHLRQVLWNLLRNAVRYAKPEAAAVRVVCRVFGDSVELSVIDNGAGVPEEDHAKLFEPFFTTHSNGTGLGLYLARELCTANGAQLEYVDDMPGAHFRILMREVAA